HASPELEGMPKGVTRKIRPLTPKVEPGADRVLDSAQVPRKVKPRRDAYAAVAREVASFSGVDVEARAHRKRSPIPVFPEEPYVGPKAQIPDARGAIGRYQSLADAVVPRLARDEHRQVCPETQPLPKYDTGPNVGKGLIANGCGLLFAVVVGHQGLEGPVQRGPHCHAPGAAQVEGVDGEKVTAPLRRIVTIQGKALRLCCGRRRPQQTSKGQERAQPYGITAAKGSEHALPQD